MHILTILNMQLGFLPCNLLFFWTFSSSLRSQIMWRQGSVDEFCFNISINHCYPHHYSLPTVLHRNSTALGQATAVFSKLIMFSCHIFLRNWRNTYMHSDVRIWYKHRFPVGIDLCFHVLAMEFCLKFYRTWYIHGGLLVLNWFSDHSFNY